MTNNKERATDAQQQSKQNKRKRTSDSFNPKSGTYNEIIEGKDWGIAVTKLIVRMKRKVTQNEVKKELFKVTLCTMQFISSEKIQRNNSIPRNVLSAYISDERGNRCGEAGIYVSLELSSGPADYDSNLFLYNPKIEFNTWKNPYEFKIEAPSLMDPALKCTKKFCHALEKFSFSKIVNNTIELSYAYFEPISCGKKPLIIWFHGAGEGGTDASIAIMANKAANFASEATQQIFGAAYVLAPQTPKVWMTSKGTPYDINNSSESTKSSMYTETVKLLIDTFITKHTDIDTERIYVGGASNGGYMTINMLLHYPRFFAAAFPVCEAYPDEWISDEQIKQLAKEHIWFTASATDTIVEPRKYILPTVERLKAAGAIDVHKSYFEKVIDTSGKYKNPDGTGHGYSC